MNNTVFVVTNPENGWDCVIGAYTSIKRAVESNDIEYTEEKDYTEYDCENFIIHKIEIDETN